MDSFNNSTTNACGGNKTKIFLLACGVVDGRRASVQKAPYAHYAV